MVDRRRTEESTGLLAGPVGRRVARRRLALGPTATRDTKLPRSHPAFSFGSRPHKRPEETESPRGCDVVYDVTGGICRAAASLHRTGGHNHWHPGAGWAETVRGSRLDGLLPQSCRPANQTLAWPNRSAVVTSRAPRDRGSDGPR